MDSELIKEERRAGGIAHLQLNRPDKHNALTTAMAEELTAKIRALREDEAVRVLILSGAGPCFCSGMDLKEAQDLTLAEGSAHAIMNLLREVYIFPKITIAAVHGHALAGGCGLASVCDFVLAEETARFGYPEVKRGLVAALVLTFAARQLSDRRLRDLFLLGELIDAKKAEEWGLISEVVPKGELKKRTEELAEAALQSAPGAVSHLKRLIEEFQQQNLNVDLQHALAIHKVMRTHREAQEGIAAFFEQRKPRWFP